MANDTVWNYVNDYLTFLKSEVIYDEQGKKWFLLCVCINWIHCEKDTQPQRGYCKKIGNDGVRKLLHDAEVDHCLSFEQVSDEVIDYYGIENGQFDTVSNCKYTVPSFLDIGKLYSIMIEDCAKVSYLVIISLQHWEAETVGGLLFQIVGSSEYLVWIFRRKEEKYWGKEVDSHVDNRNVCSDCWSLCHVLYNRIRAWSARYQNKKVTALSWENKRLLNRAYQANRLTASLCCLYYRKRK